MKVRRRAWVCHARLAGLRHLSLRGGLWYEARWRSSAPSACPRSIPAITGEGVVLRTPQVADHAEWAALRAASRDFLTPWEPTWPADDLSRASFRRRIKRYSEDQRTDLAYAFFVFRKQDNALVGGLTLANIRRGCAQAASLGYWMGAAYARQGYMTAAVNAVAAVRVRRRCGCTGSRPPASRPMPRRCGSWKRPALPARGSPGSICASTGSGRTTCCLRGSRTIRPRGRWGRPLRPPNADRQSIGLGAATVAP